MNEQIPPIPPTLPKAENDKPVKSFTERNRLAIKVLLIGFLMFMLLIPIEMITSLIREREDNAESAINEVQEKWSEAQTVIGPMLTIPYYKNDSKVISKLIILPENLTIDGEIKTETLKRGIYEVIVYNSPLTIRGEFVMPDEYKQLSPEKILTDEIMLNLALTDMRGLCDNVKVNWNGEIIPLSPGIMNRSFESGMSAKINFQTLNKEENKISFSIDLQIKGSKSLNFAPVGGTTTVNLTSNCKTPSFCGTFLPETREVDENGFKSSWKIHYLNRNYGQVIEVNQNNEVLNVSTISNSVFGVDLRLPVQQYQQAIRSVKYAFLIIILTFAVSFFVEVKQKRNIHPLQYLLIGLALCLFYSLLVSLSEHIGFTLAYLIAAVMTVLLIFFYLLGILKIKRTALTIGTLLSLLYVYIYVLIQLETFALLAGSIGLFIILAIIMYYSQKINWSN